MNLEEEITLKRERTYTGLSKTQFTILIPGATLNWAPLHMALVKESLTQMDTSCWYWHFCGSGHLLLTSPMEEVIFCEGDIAYWHWHLLLIICRIAMANVPWLLSCCKKMYINKERPCIWRRVGMSYWRAWREETERRIVIKLQSKN